MGGCESVRDAATPSLEWSPARSDTRSVCQDLDSPTKVVPTTGKKKGETASKPTVTGNMFTEGVELTANPAKQPESKGLKGTSPAPRDKDACHHEKMTCASCGKRLNFNKELAAALATASEVKDAHAHTHLPRRPAYHRENGFTHLEAYILRPYREGSAFFGEWKYKVEQLALDTIAIEKHVDQLGPDHSIVEDVRWLFPEQCRLINKHVEDRNGKLISVHEGKNVDIPTHLGTFQVRLVVYVLSTAKNAEGAAKSAQSLSFPCPSTSGAFGSTGGFTTDVKSTLSGSDTKEHLTGTSKLLETTTSLTTSGSKLFASSNSASPTLFPTSGACEAAAKAKPESEPHKVSIFDDTGYVEPYEPQINSVYGESAPPNKPDGPWKPEVPPPSLNPASLPKPGPQARERSSLFVGLIAQPHGQTHEVPPSTKMAPEEQAASWERLKAMISEPHNPITPAAQAETRKPMQEFFPDIPSDVFEADEILSVGDLVSHRNADCSLHSHRYVEKSNPSTSGNGPDVPSDPGRRRKTALPTRLQYNASHSSGAMVQSDDDPNPFKLDAKNVPWTVPSKGYSSIPEGYFGPTSTSFTNGPDPNPGYLKDANGPSRENYLTPQTTRSSPYSNMDGTSTSVPKPYTPGQPPQADGIDANKPRNFTASGLGLFEPDTRAGAKPDVSMDSNKRQKHLAFNRAYTASSPPLGSSCTPTPPRAVPPQAAPTRGPVTPPTGSKPYPSPYVSDDAAPDPAPALTAESMFANLSSHKQSWMCTSCSADLFTHGEAERMAQKCDACAGVAATECEACKAAVKKRERTSGVDVGKRRKAETKPAADEDDEIANTIRRLEAEAKANRAAAEKEKEKEKAIRGGKKGKGGGVKAKRKAV